MADWMRAFWAKWVIFAACCWLLLFFAMGDRGLVGPDEPRYASIAREMAQSGDWVTPRLGEEAWFEKPALLYWMGAAAQTLGAPEDEATRIPVALLSCAFLVLFYYRIRGSFGEDAALLGTAILGTSTGYVAYSGVGVFDLPLTATLSAALLMLLEWTRDPEEKRLLPLFGALLGLAVLAKGLVGPAIATLAVLSVAVKRGPLGPIRDLFAPRVLGPFLLVAGPWYALCWAQNGHAFFDEFIWRHHVMRLYSSEIEHVQPFWFYVPVIAAALLPWTPLLAALRPRQEADDPRLRLLLWWAVGGFLFLSVTRNKLPGYILPLLPPLAMLLGCALAKRRPGWGWFLASGALLGLLPVAQAVLPTALADGLGAAWPPADLPLYGLAPAAFAIFLAPAAAARGRTKTAVAVLATVTLISMTALEKGVFPALSESAGTRELWMEVKPQQAQTCIGDVRRHVEYGLDFYSDYRLPRCVEQPRLLQVYADPPRLERNGLLSIP